MEGKGYRTTGILLLALSLWVFVYLVVGTFLYWAALTLPVTIFWAVCLVSWIVGWLVFIVTFALNFFWRVVGLVRGRTDGGE